MWTFSAYVVAYTMLFLTTRSNAFIRYSRVPVSYARHGDIGMISSTTRSVSADELRTLLSDVTKVIVSTGFEAGISRSFQVAQASSNLLRDFVIKPKKFQDATGKLSIPRTLRLFFEELGATYIKLGQFIASSPTLFPADYVLEFQACLDKSPTVPFGTIRKIIQSELGKPISSVYSYVDPVPLASASVGQVHRAKLKNGTDVCIKVRKPGVESILQADLGFLYVGSKIFEFINPSLSRLSLSNIVGDLRESMLDELDFNKEAKNLINFRLFLDRNGIVDATAPAPYLEYCSTKVLTMDFLKGVPLIDLEGIRRYSSNPEATLISALRTWALSVADNDCFHADVHAGNLLVLEDGRVGFIDFGIVGRVSETVWSALGDLVQALVEGNFRGVAKALVRMGATNDMSPVDIDKFGQDLEAVVKKISALEPSVVVTSDLSGQQIDARLEIGERETTELVLEIVGVAENNGLKLPREFGLLLKQALYFDRYQKLLAPKLDPLRDDRVRSSLEAEMIRGSGAFRGSVDSQKSQKLGGGRNVIDVEIVE